LGFLLFFIQEIPYIIMPFVHLDTNPIMEMQSRFFFLDICEKIGGVACAVLMIFLIKNDAGFFSLKCVREKISFCAVLLSITLNFVGWGFYFCGKQSTALILALLMAMTHLYYISIGLWRKNFLLSTMGGVFFIAHFFNDLTSL